MYQSLVADKKPRDMSEPTEGEIEAFKLLKRSLTKPLVLQLSDVEKKLFIDANSKQYQAGCALFQQGDYKILHSLDSGQDQLQKRKESTVPVSAQL